MNFKRSIGFGLFTMALVAIPAAAAITANPSGADSNTFQQTANSPCVVGDPSCNQPAGLTYTSNSGPGNYDLTSPVYTATAFTTPFSNSQYNGNKIPTTFSIGVDSNIATGQGLQVLEFFKTLLCTDATGSSCAAVAANSFIGPYTLPNNNNGNGRSDITLNGFSLTAGSFYRFEASVSNATDGMEEFFIIPQVCTGPTCTPITPPVPEPSSVLLLGTAGLGLAFVLKRRFTKQA